MGFGEWVIDAFSKVTPDITGIYTDAHEYSLSGWRVRQQSMVTGTGALAVAIPGMHLVGMAADILFLMNRMAVCCYGIGAIIGKNSGAGNFLEEEDFAIILARWSGEASVGDAAVGKISADLAGKVGSKALAKVLAKEMAKGAGILVGKKLGGKVGAKIGAKFGAKLGSKAAAGFIPILGAAIGGGINLYFITSIADAAESWYKLKLSIADK